MNTEQDQTTERSNEQTLAPGWSAPAWREAAEKIDTAFDDLDSVERSIGELLEDPANDPDELNDLRGTLMAGLHLLRSVADRIEAEVI